MLIGLDGSFSHSNSISLMCADKKALLLMILKSLSLYGLSFSTKGRTESRTDIIERFHNEQIFRDPLTRLNATYCINLVIHISQFLDKLTIKYSVLSFIHFYMQQQFYTQVCYGQVCETLSIMGGRRPLTLQLTWSQKGQRQGPNNKLNISHFQGKSSGF